MKKIVKNEKNRGSVLFTVLLLLFMLSSTFFYLLEDYQMETGEKMRIQQNYLIKTMENLSSASLQNELKGTEKVQEIEKQGVFSFNCGEVEYLLQANLLKLTTRTTKNYGRITRIKDFMP